MQNHLKRDDSKLNNSEAVPANPNAGKKNDIQSSEYVQISFGTV